MATATATARASRRLLAAAGDGPPRATPAVGPASGGRAAQQFNLSSGAATAVVFVSIVLCFILLCTYCRCARQRAIAGARRRVMRELVPGGAAAALFIGRPAAASLPPVVPYSGAAAGNGKRRRKGVPEDCPICLEPFADDDGVRVVPACGHLYHAPCIDRWLDVRNSCPVCRCAVASLFDGDRAMDAAAAVAVRGGANDNDDDQEAVLERVVAMIEAIRDEQREEAAAAQQAPGRAGGGDGGS
ncbi:unnamed protein product [Urochloa decumbens]|uniref:RING-type E3 ubiquitin transferase n=1 Tax=Urochloa decumbens TaxID=240449 RepID=A0ABC8WTR9_9POAL